jgi:hypothetical protein
MYIRPRKLRHRHAARCRLPSLVTEDFARLQRDLLKLCALIGYTP